MPASLNENIDDVSVLVSGAPKVVALRVDGDKHLINVPIITQLTLTPFQRSPIARIELQAPAPNRLVGNFDATFGK